MNFYVDKDSAISYVYVHINKNHLIIVVQDKNKVYKHEDYNKAINELTDYFNEESIKSIKEHIVYNLKHLGIDIILKPKKPETEGDQFKLF